MRLIQIIFDSPILGILALFLAVVWMLRDQKDKTRPLLVFALVLNLFYGFLLTIVMGREGALFPWKYDYVLFRMDQALGIPAASIARPLQSFGHVPLGIVYQLMLPMMIFWYFAARGRGFRGSVVMAYAAELAVGPLLYAIVPALGPIYAFGVRWLHPPAVQATAIRLTGLPNAFPSLHLGTALVFVFFAPTKLWKAVALVFLAATCLATLSTGEHFVIDLIPGLAFGVFAARAGMWDFRRALFYLGIALAWSLAVRFEFPFLILHPFVTRSFAVITVALAALAVWKQWSVPLERTPALDMATEAAPQLY